MLINLVTYYSFSILIITFIIVLLFVHLITMQKIKEFRMQRKIVELIENSFSRYTNYSLIKNSDPKQEQAYDYILTIKNYTYYIKLIRNHLNAEIHVFDKDNWQLKSDAKNKMKKLIDNTEMLIDEKMDIETNENKFKLFLVYPDARRLLLYKNECELIFIEPSTDVYSTNIITFKELSNNVFVLDKTANRKN